MNRLPVARTLALLALALLAWSLVFHAGREPWLRAAGVLAQGLVRLAHPQYQNLSLAPHHRDRGLVLELNAVLPGPLAEENGRTVRLMKRTTAGVEAGLLLFHPVLLLALVTAWPPLPPGRKAAALGLALALGLVLASAEAALRLVANAAHDVDGNTLAGQVRETLNLALANGGREFAVLLAYGLCVLPLRPGPSPPDRPRRRRRP